MNATKELMVAWAQAYLTDELAREIGVEDLKCSFFEIGLDSLDEMVMIGEMEKHFGIEYDPVTLLRYPIVIEMLDAAMAEGFSKSR
jgi:acyl carrier protein